MKLYKVYALKNMVDNKIYIGKTTRKYKIRMNNGNGYRKCPRLHTAIQEYGVENFEYTTLAVSFCKKEVSELEKEYICMYDTMNPDKGYNIYKGGGGNGDYPDDGKEKLKSKIISPETIEKRRQSRMESQEIQDKVVAAYLANVTITDIKAMFGFGGNGKVYRILDANGIERLNNFTKWTGKQHSEETKKKMSERRAEYWKNK